LDGADVRFNPGQRDTGNVKIVGGLQVHPELCRSSEVTRQPERRVWRDGAPLVYDLAHPGWWHPKISGEAVDADAEIGHELLAQDFARVKGRSMKSSGHTIGLRSVIIGDLHIVSIAVAPLEANPILIVDPNAMLMPAIAFQAFQPVARQGAKIGKLAGSIDHPQLLKGPSRTTLKASTLTGQKQSFAFTIVERLDQVRL